MMDQIFVQVHFVFSISKCNFFDSFNDSTINFIDSMLNFADSMLNFTDSMLNFTDSL